MNAGSNRTGKRIIDELLEATQSHRVKRTSDLKNGRHLSTCKYESRSVFFLPFSFQFQNLKRLKRRKRTKKVNAKEKLCR